MVLLNALVKILKFLWRAILGFVIVFLAILLIVHIPTVQNRITIGLSNYLSAKIKAPVQIERVEFSIFGNVTIYNFAVWSRTNEKLLSIRKIVLISDVFDLISGDFIFEELRITGVEGKLAQSETEFNLQFIIDAFVTEQNQSGSTENILLIFRQVQLEDVSLEYTSIPGGLLMTTDLGAFQILNAEISTSPVTIKATRVLLQNTSVRTFLTSDQLQKDSAALKDDHTFTPDFGTGVIFDIKELTFEHNAFSFHRDTVMTPLKFDPDHLDLTNIELKLSDAVMGKDTLTAVLKSLAANTPGFQLTDANTEVHMNSTSAASSFQFTSGVNSLEGAIKATSDDSMDLSFALTAAATVNPRELAYFLSDSVLQYFTQWTKTTLTIEADHAPRQTNFTTLKLRTTNSQLNGAGNVYDILDGEKLHWENMNIEATLGPDFKSTLTAFTGAFQLRSNVAVNVLSSGNPGNIFIDGKVKYEEGTVHARGFISPEEENVGLDLAIKGDDVNVQDWIVVPWLGPLDVTAQAKGTVGRNQDLKFEGSVTDTKVFDRLLRNLAFEGSLKKDSALINVAIDDSGFRSEISSRISLVDPITLTNRMRMDHFRPGLILPIDTNLSISGEANFRAAIGESSLEGELTSQEIIFRNRARQFELNGLSLIAASAPDSTHVDYSSSNAHGTFNSNFSISELSDIIPVWTGNILNVSKNKNGTMNPASRRARFDLQFENAMLLNLLGVDVDQFSSLKVAGAIDEAKRTSILELRTGNFGSQGLYLDTLSALLSTSGDSVRVLVSSDDLFYDSLSLGNLRIKMLNKGDTVVTSLSLISDSLRSVYMGARILPQDSGVLFFPDTLYAFGKPMQVRGPISVGSNYFTADDFGIAGNDMRIRLNGNMDAFEASLQNIDLRVLNYFLPGDTTVVNNGRLSGAILYSRAKQLNLDLVVDSLSLYHSSPFAISAHALSNNNEVPFEMVATNASNKIDLRGRYFANDATVDANLKLDILDLRPFTFLGSGFIEKMNGAVRGQTSITGPIAKPALEGNLKFEDATVTTLNPRLTFHVKDSEIDLQKSSFLFKDFRMFDDEQNPLVVNGYLNLKDYQELHYDLRVSSDNYTILNTPDSIGDKLRGLLVLGSNINLKSDGKDTNIEAQITIRDKTKLTFETSSSDVELLNSEGIIEFVDPKLLYDSVALNASTSFYDSLIATLPDFNLNADVAVEDNARLRIIIDPQSGDYIETSGNAALDLGYDRTGNLRLSGNYTVKEGVYRLSFYDLVKKNFTLLPGSSINWNGSPENGDLNIKAVHTVESNSIGLIGHEIGESEKSIYKRSLDYEVGININGTIEKPVISFSLDLPKQEKANYPVLANKLDRLRQPEYASELNKQVFGLLVLGGFLPESSSDINSNVVATTALSNSVNALLASQFNRFASQYVKGVNIDVGIQSYSDYSAPGGKTQTAMDFRVSKKIMNDRLSFEVGGDFDINQGQSGAKSGNKNYRGDIAIIYDLTGNGDKQLKLFNNETYDIIYQEIRNTGISVIFIREFASKPKQKDKEK